MRAIDPTLTTALANGTGIPFLKGYLGYTDGSAIHAQELIGYKLSGRELEFEMAYQGDFAGDQTAIWLERGLTIAGINYTVTTGRFFIHSQRYLPNGHQIVRGGIFPKQYLSVPGGDTYQNVISAVCSAFGKTAIFRNGAAAWLGYQFFPSGKSLLLNDANYFFNVLQQKYLIFGCDYGGGQILFYDCASPLGAVDATIGLVNDFYKETTRLRNRLFIWVDESGVHHMNGAATDPIHNLGYLESTASPPSRHSPSTIIEAHLRPDLRLLDGDVLSLTGLGSSSKVCALIFEQYSQPSTDRRQLPSWEMIIRANPVFDNTEGGAILPAVEAVTSYAAVNTSMFDNVLSANDNNIQQALNTLDDHSHGAGFMPYAYPIAVPANAAFSSALALPANGGSIAIPIPLDASILLDSVTLRNTDTASARTWGWDLYEQAGPGDNLLARVATCAGNQSFTPTAASQRTLAAAGAPVLLPPGLYWLVIQNRHASNTFGLGTNTLTMAANLAQTKTTPNPNGATLDFTAATWTKQQSMAAARLNGRVFGQSTAF